MNEMIIIQLTRDELAALINEAVQSALEGKLNQTPQKTQIKGIHELAKFLKVSPGRAQKLKNEKVIPCFQDVRLVLFDPEKVLKAMESHNVNSVKRNVKKK
jgi:hypothetical protein